MPANKVPALPLHGKDVALTIFVGGKPMDDSDNVQSVTITEVNTQHVDKLLGRANDRLDETPGHFELAISGMYASAAIYAALQAQKAARAANQTPIQQVSVGMVWTNRDGSQSAYIASTCTTNQTLKVGGKDDPVMHDLKVMAEDFVEQEL